MKFKEIKYPQSSYLELKDFKTMDYYAVENYNLPIELMMENAGAALARVIANHASKNQIVKIGIGNGNNGGGGLVAARRLVAWGYRIYIDLATEITKKIPSLQLKRALSFGVRNEPVTNPDIWVDAYLGFSQRLPLNENFLDRINAANISNAYRISLDIPTGFLGDPKTTYFKADTIVSLAAPKKILINFDTNTEIFIADLGIPNEVYKRFNVEILPFDKSGIIKLM